MTARLLFNEEMKALDQEIVRMGDLAREMIKMGVQAFLENDAELRTKVEELDRQIYLAEQAIEKHCVEIIALHQPVAGDLRMVTTSLKIITDLNRIGRYGRDIAELATRDGGNGKRFRKLVAVPLMAEVSMSMVTDAIDSFVERDDKKALALFRRDDEVDGLWDSIFRESLTHMMEDPRSIGIGTSYILVARYLERIADHACNIGDRVIFLSTGVRMDPYERKQRKGTEPLEAREQPGRATPTDGYYSMNLDEK